MDLNEKAFTIFLAYDSKIPLLWKYPIPAVFPMYKQTFINLTILPLNHYIKYILPWCDYSIQHQLSHIHSYVTILCILNPLLKKTIQLKAVANSIQPIPTQRPFFFFYKLLYCISIQYRKWQHTVSYHGHFCIVVLLNRSPCFCKNDILSILVLNKSKIVFIFIKINATCNLKTTKTCVMYSKKN